MYDIKYMEMALELARKAAAVNEIPVGCVIVNEKGDLIGQGYNQRHQKKSPLSHAEMEAITAAARYQNDWRLDRCSLYVTLEPCPMCAGAIIQARIPVLIYGAKEPVSGSCGSILNIFEENYGHKPAIYGGILAEESRALMQQFFLQKRIDKDTNM